MKAQQSKLMIVLALASMTFACGGGDGAGNGIPPHEGKSSPGIKVDGGNQQIRPNIQADSVCYLQAYEDVDKQPLIHTNANAVEFMSIVQVSVTDEKGAPAKGKVKFYVDKPQLAGLQSFNPRIQASAGTGCHYFKEVVDELDQYGKGKVVLMSTAPNYEKTPIKVHAVYGDVEDSAVIYIDASNPSPQLTEINFKVKDPSISVLNGDKPSTIFEIEVTQGGSAAPDPDNNNIEVSLSGDPQARLLDDAGGNWSKSLRLRSHAGKVNMALRAGNQVGHLNVKACTNTANDLSRGGQRVCKEMIFTVLENSAQCMEPILSVRDHDLGIIQAQQAYSSSTYRSKPLLNPCAVLPVTRVEPGPGQWTNLPAGLEIKYGNDITISGTPTQLSQVDAALPPPPVKEEEGQTVVERPVYVSLHSGYPIPDVFTINYRDAAGRAFKENVRVSVVAEMYTPTDFLMNCAENPNDPKDEKPLNISAVKGTPFNLELPIQRDRRAKLNLSADGLPEGLTAQMNVSNDAIIISGTPTQATGEEEITATVTVTDTFVDTLAWLQQENYGIFNGNMRMPEDESERSSCSIAFNVVEPKTPETIEKFTINECSSEISFDYSIYPETWKQSLALDFIGETGVETSKQPIKPNSNVPTPVTIGLKPHDSYQIAYPVKFSIGGQSLQEGKRWRLGMEKIFGNSLDEFRELTYTITATDANGNSASKNCGNIIVRRHFPEQVDGADVKTPKEGTDTTSWLELQNPKFKKKEHCNSDDFKSEVDKQTFTIKPEKSDVSCSFNYATEDDALARRWLEDPMKPSSASKVPGYKPSLSFSKENTRTQVSPSIPLYWTISVNGHNLDKYLYSGLHSSLENWLSFNSNGVLTAKIKSCKGFQTIQNEFLKTGKKLPGGGDAIETVTIKMKLKVADTKAYNTALPKFDSFVKGANFNVQANTKDVEITYNLDLGCEKKTVNTKEQYVCQCE